MEFSDWIAIYNLLHQYPRCADKGDFEGVGKFHAHAKIGLVGGEQAEPAGAEDAAERYRNIVRKFSGRGTPRTRHVLSNIVITDDGPNSVKSESYLTVFQQTENLALQPIASGTCFDRFEKVDGHWRLTERLEDVELLGELSEHLLGDGAEMLRSHVALQSKG